MKGQIVLIYDESVTEPGIPVARLMSFFVPRIGEYITVQDGDDVSQYIVKFVGYMASAKTHDMMAAVYCRKLRGAEKTEDDNEE